MKRCMGCMKTYGDNNEKCPHCGYAEGIVGKETFHIPPGTILSGRYIIGKAIGYGGFGITYIGWDALLETRIAIKEYLPLEISTRVPGQKRVTVFSGEKQERFQVGIDKFLEEAGRLMELRSVPGIVQFFNCFKENGTAYIIMEYLEGETLKEKLERDGKLPADLALNIIMPVIETMEKVHREGILHRDISPDNIFLTKDWKIKLMDFGAARHAVDDSKSLSVFVKEGYAPEEQYQGKNQGPWTDVYAIAATFYRMVTGIEPQDAMDRKEKDTLKPLSKLGVDIPENIENAIMNALNRNMEDRTKDCSQFKEEILDSNAERNYIRQRKTDIGRWPLWLRVISGAAGVVTVIMIVLLLTGVVEFHFTDSVQTMLEKNDVEVPEVVARTKDEAEKRIKEAGLIPQYVDYIEDARIPGDCIYSQSPGANERVKRGETVFLVVSCGMEEKKMINAVGYNADVMEGQLKQKGIDVQKIHEASYGEKGTVIRQILGNKEIEEGAVLKEGMVVTLVVSDGIEDLDTKVKTEIPDFKGKTYKESLELAEQCGVYISIGRDKPSKNQPRGHMLKQNVSAGTRVMAGTVVKLTRSIGDIVLVPDFELKSLYDVKKLAKSQGITYEVVYEESETVARDHVISQSIEKNTEIQYTDVIILTVSKGNAKAKKYQPAGGDEKQLEEEKAENNQAVWDNAAGTQMNQETSNITSTTVISEENTQEKRETGYTQKESDGWTSDDSLTGSQDYTYETKTQYLVRKRNVIQETETSDSPELDGWTLSYKQGTYGEYGEWSEWSETEVISSDTRQVEKKEESRDVITGYKYYHYHYWDTEDGKWKDTYTDSSGGAYEEKITKQPLTLNQDYNGHMGTTGQEGYGIWWPVGNGEIHENQMITLYRYCEREVSYTYYFVKNVYGEWEKEEWLDEKPEESDTCEIINTRTLYRYSKK